MIRYSVKELNVGIAFSDATYLDNQFILTTPEMRISHEMKKSLKMWGFSEIFSNGVPVTEAQVDETAHAKLASVTSQHQTNSKEKIDYAEQFYTAFKGYMESVFEDIDKKNILNYQELTDHVRSACDTIRQDRCFLLRSQKTQSIETEADYMASHAVRSMIISVTIGLRLKLSNEKLIELGVAALLHEIGMLKLPKESFCTQRLLTQSQRKAIISHPILGYSLLESFNVPLAVRLAGLEHHERENGGGYPQKLTGDKISLYAKIIAVACSYDASITDRPHKEAENGYTSMLYLLQNKEKQYNKTVVDALLYSLSLYPIGLFVLLSNGKRAQVVDVNPENPLYPIVQILGIATTAGKNVIVETSKEGIYIVRPLTKSEAGRAD
jgi:HD-GYP domain-containing protein (c-di-GMP phosphodiesterase class II)